MSSSSTLISNIFVRIFPEEKGVRPFFLFLTLLFFALSLGVGMVHHEMWRDELESWLIASGSSSLADLFHNMKMGSNPYGWTLLLHFTSLVSLNPVVVQVAHFVFSVGAMYLFLRFAPFKVAQKILFCFGYYALYEYGVISRGYAMTLFFLFLFCSLFRKYWTTGIPLAIVIFFLANATGGFGVILSISLLIFMISNHFLDEMHVLGDKKNIKYLVLSVIIILFSIWVAMRSMSPPADSVYASAWFTHFDYDRFVEVFWRIWFGFVPIPKLSGPQFWNTNILIGRYLYPSITYYLTSFSLFILGFNILIFSRRLSVLLFYLSGTFGILLFSYLQTSIFYINASRYHGFLFLIFIVSLWLLAFFPEKNNVSVPVLTSLSKKPLVQIAREHFLNLFLVVNVLVAVIACYKDYKYRFSSAEEAGKFIVEHKLENMPATGFIDCTVSPITAYTRHAIYYPDRDTTSTFPVWTSKNHTVEKERMLARLVNYVSKRNDSVLVVLNSVLDTTVVGEVRFIPLVSYHECIVSDENLSVYIAKRQIRVKPE